MEDPNMCMEEPGVESSKDWRSELPPDSRQRHVDSIMETLKRYLPVSGDEALSMLKKIAGWFEEKIYTAATNQSDYLRKIYLKLLAMETKFQDHPMGDSLLSNSVVPSTEPLDSTSQSMQPQALNQGHSMPVPMSSNLPQSHQQLLSAQISSSLPSAVSPIAGLASASMPNIVGPNRTMRNVSGVPQSSVGNSMGLGVRSNVFSNSQRPIQGRRVVSQQQSQNLQQQLLLQQQLQLQLQQPIFQQGSIPQQQQNLMPPNQLQIISATCFTNFICYASAKPAISHSTTHSIHDSATSTASSKATSTIPTTSFSSPAAYNASTDKLAFTAATAAY